MFEAFHRYLTEGTAQLKQRAIEYAADKGREVGTKAASAAAEKIQEQGPEMAQNFAVRTYEQTADALSVQSAITALNHPKEVRRYLEEITQPVRDLPQIVYDPVGMARQHFGKTYQGAKRFGYLYRELDSGRKLRHAGAATGEVMADNVAGTVGLGAILYAASRFPRNRAKTEAMRQRVFPREQFFRGAFSRQLLLRFTVGTPTARLLALPVLYGTFAAYVFTVKAGHAIEDREYLSAHYPEIKKSMDASGQGLSRATFYRSAFDAVLKTREPSTTSGSWPWPFG